MALNAELSGNANSIALRALQGVVGPASIGGEAQLLIGGEKPSVQAKLTTGEVLLDQFLPPVTVTAVAGSELPWSGAPLDLAFLDALNAEIEWRATHFVWREFDFTETALTGAIQDGVAQLRQLNGKLFGGPLQMSASLNGRTGTPAFAAKIELSDADSAAASAALFGESLITGKFNLSAEAGGEGASTFALVSSLEGGGKLSLTGGAINGIDLPALSDKLKELQEVNDLMALVRNSFISGQTRVNKIEAPFSLTRGVIRSQDTVIDIDPVAGNLSVSIDLPRYWLDAGSKITLKDHPSAPNIGVSFIGPLNNPERKVSADAFQSYFTVQLVSKGLERLLEEGKPAPIPAAPAASPPSTVPLPGKPADVTP